MSGSDDMMARPFLVGLVRSDFACAMRDRPSARESGTVRQQQIRPRVTVMKLLFLLDNLNGPKLRCH